jgi:hypothetical protein
MNSAVVHLSATGAQLWRGVESLIYIPIQVSVNSTDASCWVIELDDNWIDNPNVSYLVHLAEDGAELWRSAGYTEVSVNPVDGSCWAVSDANEVVHLAADGTELWRGVGTLAGAMSVNAADGSCWVADGRHGQVVHLVVRTDFSDTPYYYWAFHQIEAAYAADIVKGYSDGTYKPTDPVTRDQMAVYISRALDNVPTSFQTHAARRDSKDYTKPKPATCISVVVSGISAGRVKCATTIEVVYEAAAGGIQ